MQSSRKDRLAAKVKAVNRANGIAHELFPVLTAIFAPLVGKQIIKATGGLLAKYEKLLPEFPNTGYLRVYRHQSEYSLAWTVNTSEHDSINTVLYHEVTFYVGELRGGVLERLSPHPFVGRTDYTEHEIQEKRARYEAAKKAADEARSDLYPFGEYDN